MIKALPAIVLLLSSTGLVRAGEPPSMLKTAPGRDLVEAHCAACHSLDYPRSNAPFLDRKGWEAEVGKMIKAYGAPIPPEDAKTIIDYLVANYGNGA